MTDGSVDLSPCLEVRSWVHPNGGKYFPAQVFLKRGLLKAASCRGFSLELMSVHVAVNKSNNSEMTCFHTSASKPDQVASAESSAAALFVPHPTLLCCDWLIARSKAFTLNVDKNKRIKECSVYFLKRRVKPAPTKQKALDYHLQWLFYIFYNFDATEIVFRAEARTEKLFFPILHLIPSVKHVSTATERPVRKGGRRKKGEWKRQTAS